MKTFLLCLLMVLAPASYADQLARRISVKQVLVDANKFCRSYYSLGEAGTFCKDDRLYRRMFVVRYSVNGQLREATVDYYPESQFKVSDNGDMFAYSEGHVNRE